MVIVLTKKLKGLNRIYDIFIEIENLYISNINTNDYFIFILFERLWFNSSFDSYVSISRDFGSLTK